MPLNSVPLPASWDVPKVAGVPTLATYAIEGAEAAASVIVGTALEDLLVSEAAAQWGIFDKNGQRVATTAHVVSLGTIQESRITSAPMEKGAFASVNKVSMPRMVRVMLVCDEDLATRAAFLSAVQAAAASTDLFTLSTPEAVYQNMNITHVERDIRQGGSPSMLRLMIGAEEVRGGARALLASAGTSSLPTKEPSGAAPINIGQVNPAAVTSQS
ncbi:phage baseplate protein [Acetobacter sp. P5B1]|uniref:phage baseplate protein n=1 Tax=Acetobacter sp. P5B1 TaxID=2762620 RepID=UPI001C044210|nr:hypothetical protein [Acetobacter sp. P5B1]